MPQRIANAIRDLEHVVHGERRLLQGGLQFELRPRAPPSILARIRSKRRRAQADDNKILGADTRQ